MINHNSFASYESGYAHGHNKALKDIRTVIENIKSEIMSYRDSVDRAISEDEFKRDGMKVAYQDCIEIIDEYIGKIESENKK